MTKHEIITAKDDPFELNGTDKQILQIIVDHPTLSNKAIGKMLGFSENTIQRRRKKPAFMKAYADLMATTDDLLKRAQKIAARRLIALIKDPDKKVALEATKLALSPLNNKHTVDVKEEIIFQTRIGSQGQLMQEVIEVDSTHKEDTSTKEQSQDEQAYEQNDNQSKS